MGTPWTERKRVMVLRRRFALADVLAEMVGGFRRHRTGRSAALLAHYSFLSVFPLLLVMATILGYALHNHPRLQKDIVGSVLVNLPIVGPQIENNVTELRGNALALVIGVVSVMWAGMKAFVGAQASVDDIWDVPLDRRPNFWKVRLRALGTIALAGVSQILGAGLAALAGIGEFRFIERVGLIVAGIIVNTVALGASYRMLTSVRLTPRAVAPGAFGAALVFAILQLVGTALVGRAIANASAVYGTFATVIGVFSWLSLHTTVALAGVELNRALELRRTGASASLRPRPHATATL